VARPEAGAAQQAGPGLALQRPAGLVCQRTDADAARADARVLVNPRSLMMNTPLSAHRDIPQGFDAGIANSLEGLGHQATQIAIDGARSVREHALQARDSAAGFVQHKPLPALLLAAAGGAAVMLLAGWLMRSSASRH
jgi:hypothetical protein